jgi:hypothetical protein
VSNCAALGLELTSMRWGDAVKLQTGRASGVGQIYSPQPRHPADHRPAAGHLPEGRKLDLAWARLEASLRHDGAAPEQVSLVMTEPNADPRRAGPGQ